MRTAARTRRHVKHTHTHTLFTLVSVQHAPSHPPSILYRCTRGRRCFPRQHYSVLHILPGAICGAAGIACFTQATKQNYYIIHSLWHVLMAVAIACLLPCVNKAGEDKTISSCMNLYNSFCHFWLI